MLPSPNPIDPATLRAKRHLLLQADCTVLFYLRIWDIESAKRTFGTFVKPLLDWFHEQDREPPPVLCIALLALHPCR